ncbi:MAG TPA: hypothetical protein VGD08_25775 [Stellaceae bacterium]|jgi:hypothetical protein
MRTTLFALTLCAVAGGALAAPALPVSAPGRGKLPVVTVDAHLGAAADDTDFLFRLGMLEGHLMIGHELLQNNQASLALPHFGHPVRELYDDISGYLQQKRFPPFDRQLAALEALIAAAPTAPKTEAAYQDAVATVRKARDLAPAELRASIPEMISICSDTIDAASGEFGEALEHGRIASIVEYHDSKGYLEYVAQQLDDLSKTHPDPESQGVLERFRAILAKAQWIVEPLLPSAAPRASVSTYRSFAKEAATLAKQ